MILFGFIMLFYKWFIKNEFDKLLIEKKMEVMVIFGVLYIEEDIVRV